uniref:Methyltransferase FkbM domain-containing protein n=1 Tax=viral metagenome TaxID=1070528 RepID=A0A6C0DYM0_9ZZZZ
MFNGQAEQDKFVLNVLNNKKNGYFLEIGSNHPININNSYLLEIGYDWKGIMIEYDNNFLPLYKQFRPNSIHVINDARAVDYKKLFEQNNFPTSLDYLQIDLEAINGSTIQTLQKLDNEIFDTYKFATVTFEHDIYHTNFANTRLESRKIFKKRGYICVFEDINNRGVNPYEDWYVHPDLVNMDYVNKLIENNKSKFVNNHITVKTINWQDIQYI